MTDLVVTQNASASRFEAHLDGERCGVADYVLSEHTITFTHTIVDPAYEGRGVGSALVRFALDAVRADGELVVVAQCPFVAAWIDRHPAYTDLLQDS